MSDFIDSVSGIGRSLGETFLIAFGFPAAAFVALHLTILVPVWQVAFPTTAAPLPTLLPAIGGIDLNFIIYALGSTFIIAILLSAVNELLIQAYSGSYGWLRNGLLRPWTSRNKALARKQYRTIEAHRFGYRYYAQLPEQNNVSLTNLKELTKKLNKAHEQRKQKGIVDDTAKKPVDDIPQLVKRLERIAPTAFGNAFVQVVDYVVDHYRMDPALFWSRLLVAMAKDAPEDIQRIRDAKARVDMTMNLSLLSGVLSLEAVLILLFAGNTSVELSIVRLLLVATVLATFVFYRAATVSALYLAELMCIAFDQHRQRIFTLFGLHTPSDFDHEQEQWETLAKFIEFGEPFYYSEIQALTPDKTQN